MAKGKGNCVPVAAYPHEDRQAVDDIEQPRLAGVPSVRAVAVEHPVAEDDRAEANPENDGTFL